MAFYTNDSPFVKSPQEMFMDFERARIAKKEMDDKMCNDNPRFGPGYQYLPAVDKCVPMAFESDGKNVQDLAAINAPDNSTGVFTEQPTALTNPPDSNSSANAEIATEVNKRKADNVRSMRKPKMMQMAGDKLA